MEKFLLLIIIIGLIFIIVGFKTLISIKNDPDASLKDKDACCTKISIGLTIIFVVMAYFIIRTNFGVITKKEDEWIIEDKKLYSICALMLSLMPCTLMQKIFKDSAFCTIISIGSTLIFLVIVYFIIQAM